MQKVILSYMHYNILENEKVLENVLRTAKAQIVPINLDKAQFPLLDVKIPGTICVCPNEYFEGFFIAKIKKT